MAIIVFVILRESLSLDNTAECLTLLISNTDIRATVGHVGKPFLKGNEVARFCRGGIITRRSYRRINGKKLPVDLFGGEECVVERTEIFFARFLKAVDPRVRARVFKIICSSVYY